MRLIGVITGSKLKKRTYSRYGCLWLFLFLFLIYILVYGVLSSQGEYILHNRGGMDWNRSWCPKFLVYPRYPWDPDVFTSRTRIDISTLGWFYIPLIITDWILWHPTIPQ